MFNSYVGKGYWGSPGTHDLSLAGSTGGTVDFIIHSLSRFRMLEILFSPFLYRSIDITFHTQFTNNIGSDLTEPRYS